MKPNWLSDARLIPDEVMSYLRKIAVNAVEENHYSPEDVIKILGFSRSVIYDWLKRYQKDGYAGLDTKKAPGVSPIVTEEMDAWMKQTILDSTPEDFGYDTTLWTCDLLTELLSERYDVHVIGATVNHHLHQLGLTNQKPNDIAREQEPADVEHFVKEEFPKIQGIENKLGADIGFEDEAAVDLRDHSGKTWGERGIRPDVYVTGQRGRVNILSVVTAQGAFDDQVTEQSINSKEYIEFLKTLIKDRTRPLFLIVDRAPFHRSKKVRTFIWHHRRNIRLFYLPSYSPELNPDEHAWEEIKDKQLGRKSIKNKRDLKEHIHCALESLKDRAERIISFFHLPETQYAAAQ